MEFHMGNILLFVQLETPEYPGPGPAWILFGSQFDFGRTEGGPGLRPRGKDRQTTVVAAYRVIIALAGRRWNAGPYEPKPNR